MAKVSILGLGKTNGGLQKLLLALGAAVMLATSCVRTADHSPTAAVWPGRDKFDQHYSRSVSQTYAAASKIVTRDGALLLAYNPHDTTNEARCLKARVDNCDVWIRVQSVDASPAVAAVSVQAYTRDNRADLGLANQLNTEIGAALDHRMNQ